MQKFYSYLLLILVLCITLNCKKDKDNVTPTPVEKQIPEGSRKVSIEVDAKYDLNNTIAYGLMDSVSMTAKDKYLAVPKGSGDYIVFLDKNTDKVMAVGIIDSISNELLINAKSVTAGMHDLIPNYLSLPEVLRKDFNAKASSLPEYLSLVSMVDKLISNNDGIYSTNDEFIKQLLKVNSYITENYFEKIADKGGRKASDEDIKYWLVKNTAPGATNQVYSHVDAIVTPSLVDKGPAAKTYDVKPRTLPKAALNTPTLLPLKDGYYDVLMSQKTRGAQTNNEKKIVQGAINVLFGFIGGKLTGSDNQKCTAALTLSVTNDLLQEMLSPPTDWKSAALTIVKIGTNTFQKFVKSESCLKAFVDPKVILSIVAQKSNVYSATVKNAQLAIQIAELGPWIVGRWIDPVEISTQMQVYKKKIIPGTIGFEKIDGSLLEGYEAGEKARPAVQAKILSKYDDIDLAVFEATWIVTQGNGTISPPKNAFNHEGKTVTTWTLPTEVPKEGGTYFLRADILDGDSEDLQGSPIKFETKFVGDSLEYYKNVIPGKWTITWDKDPASPMNDINKFDLKPDGTGIYYYLRNRAGQESNIDPSSLVYKLTWSVSRSEGKYYLTVGGYFVYHGQLQSKPSLKWIKTEWWGFTGVKD